MSRPSLLRNPRTQVLAVIGVVTVAAFSAWWMYKYVPTQAEARALARTEARLLAANQAGRRSLALLGIDGVQSVLHQLDQQAAQVGQLVPPVDAAAPLDHQVNQQALATGVTIAVSTPMPDTTDRGFVVHRTAYAVRGAYHDVGAFLTGILSLGRVSQVADFTLQSVPATADDRFGSGRPVEASFLFRAYHSPAAGGPTAGTATAPDRAAEAVPIGPAVGTGAAPSAPPGVPLPAGAP